MVGKAVNKKEGEKMSVLNPKMAMENDKYRSLLLFDYWQYLY